MTDTIKSSFYTDNSKVKGGQKAYTILIEGHCRETHNILIAVIHLFAFNPVEAVERSARGAWDSGLMDYVPIALFAGHHFCILPADYSKPLPIPSPEKS